MINIIFHYKFLLFGGGLGNQIFEYYFYLWLRKKYPNIVFLGCYRKASFKAHNGLEISDVFDVDLPNDGGLSGRFISYVLSVLSRIIPSLSMKANTEYSSKYLLINAYQPNLLFYLNEEKIKFRPFKLDEVNWRLLNSIQLESSVSIHIRRGDYLSDQYRDIYSNICTLAYYRKAIDKCKEILKSPHFFVFSDDIEWARDVFVGREYEFVSNNIGKNSFIDIFLMSNCKIQIIANSTFSYWAAYLSNSLVKIYPAKWIHGIEKPNIFPDNWIGL